MEEFRSPTLPFQDLLPFLREKQTPGSYSLLCFPQVVIVSFAISAVFLMALTVQTRLTFPKPHTMRKQLSA